MDETGSGDSGDPVSAGGDRDRCAEDRDQGADTRDRASATRDEDAGARDTRAEAREAAADSFDAGAAADRAGALQDRRRGASDRTHAADDRAAASSDRDLAAEDRAANSIDDLTGAHTREAGLVALRRDIARARRTGQPFALAFVDVDDLKATNDSHGHLAGDRLLCEAAGAIRAHLRSYDLLARVGGDEFLCGIPGLALAKAAERFALVNEDLAAIRQAVTVGLAELQPDDALEDLIARADKALYRQRHKPRSDGP